MMSTLCYVTPSISVLHSWSTATARQKLWSHQQFLTDIQHMHRSLPCPSVVLYMHRHGHTHTYTHTLRQTDTRTHTDTYAHTHTHTHTHRSTHACTQPERQRQRQMERRDRKTHCISTLNASVLDYCNRLTTIIAFVGRASGDATSLCQQSSP